MNFMGGMSSNQSPNTYPASTMATHGSNSATTSNYSQSNNSNNKNQKSGQKQGDEDFGVFQSSDTDAWSMGQGLGKHL